MLVRRFLGLVMATAVGFLPVVPAEHVHEVDHHGHLELVVHRHLQAHEVAGSRHSTTVDDNDGPVATLDQDYIVPAPVHLDAVAGSGAVSLPDVSSASCSRYSAFVERLIHGPPRGPTPDRGPPSTLAS